MKKPFLVFMLAGHAWISPASAQSVDGYTATSGWRTYSVPQFGTRVEYPASLFSVPAGKTRRGIGERFRTRDGRAIFSVYSRPNAAGETPVTYLRKNLQRPRSNLHYERITSSFFAISESANGRIYYSRCNFPRVGAIHCFDLEYPAREKRAWDSIVTRISRSLRPLHG